MSYGNQLDIGILGREFYTQIILLLPVICIIVFINIVDWCSHGMDDALREN